MAFSRRRRSSPGNRWRHRVPVLAVVRNPGRPPIATRMIHGSRGETGLTGSREPTPREIVENYINSGRLLREDVEAAREYWRVSLQLPIAIVTGEAITVTESDFDHLILDPRIVRKPYRVMTVLTSIFEIRDAHHGRRRAMSVWDEGENRLQGYAILEVGGTVRTIHLVRRGEAERLRRQGALLWKRSI